MRKIQLLILAAAVAAGGIWWGFYRTHHTSSRAVAALLPRETLALVHVPDFNRSRDEWHRTDLYQLWQEPAVQEFFAKPRSRVGSEGRVGKTIEEISAIDVKDAFFALVSIEHGAWEWEGGFRCAGDPDQAAKTVDQWKANILGTGADLKRETADYQGRQIQNESAGVIKLATVWAGPWFFFANDVEKLKALLDHADGRNKDLANTLASEENYVAASNRMPGSYSALVFARPAQIAEKAMPAGDAPKNSNLAQLRQIQSFCGASAFVGGRIRDTLFVGTPKVADLENLSRAALPLATKDTFLYAATVLDLRKEMAPGWQSPGVGWLAGLKNILDALSENGVTLDEWKAAFSSEADVIGSWTTDAQWPSVVAAMAVKDSAKANKIVTTITNTPAGDVRWTHREKEGVHYYSTGSGLPLFSISPTIGLSDRMLVLGADAGSVEAAMKRNASGPSELAAARNFQNAERTVPTAQQAFAYVDPALLYARFDAKLRPLLAMGAAFVPSLAESVDVNKLPSADVVAKHLSPTVMSQSYQSDGYLAESIGSVPFYQTAVGGITAGVLFAAFRYSQEHPSLPPGSVTMGFNSPTPSPSPIPSPSGSPR